MKGFFTIYFSTIAAILSFVASVVFLWRWLRGFWEKQFLAKPREKVVTTPFSYIDVNTGISELVVSANLYSPDLIIGINRGGAIVGGILSKHLEKFIYIIEVKTNIKKHVRFDGNMQILAGKKVLLVDDRLTKGDNMDAAYRYLKKHAADVRKIVFAWIEVPFAKTAPDAWGYKVKSKFIPLPWEPGHTKEWH